MIAAVLARGWRSAVWPLTAAFALPLFLGLAVLMGGAYALIMRADVEAAQTAAANDAELVQGDIRVSLGYSSFYNAATSVVQGRLDAQDPQAQTKAGEAAGAAGPRTGETKTAVTSPPVTTFYRLAQHDGRNWRVLEGEAQAQLLDPGCPWWSPRDWGQCFGASPGAHAPRWVWIAMPADPDWGVAEAVDITALGRGMPGVDVAGRPQTVVYVGRRFALAEVRAGILGLAGWTLAAAGLAALALGLLVSLSMLRRVEAVNQVCDRVMQGDLAARAGGEAAPDEFGDLSRHVNTMLEQINALVLGLRDVSNRIAHDLRTPLARLKGRLEDVAEADDVAAARAGAEAAAAETDEILATFQALLDIAEVEAGAGGGLQPMRLDEAAGSAIDLYDAVAEEAGVTLIPALGEARMLGEPALVVRLAANLVDNAIKFSPRGGAVRVEVARRDGEAVIVVADGGPGIPEADRERVMRRFVRGGASGSAPGHGLGLALVAAVAKRHGAKIRMSDAQPGLRIEVTFKAF